ncbi:MAG: hypothetical protein JWR62_701 [Modestobacter sp.]|jgi:hypothetical protein|nr:hypothetical protein [Modestobacter sp.]
MTDPAAVPVASPRQPGVALGGRTGPLATIDRWTR